MHKSLTVRTNTVLLALYGAMCAISIFASGFDWHLLVLVPFALAGLAAGLLQTRTIKENLTTFMSLKSWSEVRSQLMRTTAGKASIMMLWLCGLVLLSLMLFTSLVPNPAIAIGAYSAFGLMREIGARSGVQNLGNSTCLRAAA